VLDIDILLYEEQIVDEPNLQVPHREMLNRAFVLIPLCEISPDATMPNGDSICVLVADPAITAQSILLGGPPPFP
jgi:2-amino-4-hydroxy-6-hydroxymethyldihydropteridine diphosphokinase